MNIYKDCFEIHFRRFPHQNEIRQVAKTLRLGDAGATQGLLERILGQFSKLGLHINGQIERLESVPVPRYRQLLLHRRPKSVLERLLVHLVLIKRDHFKPFLYTR